MVKSVEGIYRNGSVELIEPLSEAEGSHVIVTWVSSRSVDPVIEESTNLRRSICATDCPRLQRIGIGLKWRPTMNCRRGDVVLVLFPDSNLRTTRAG